MLVLGDFVLAYGGCGPANGIRLESFILRHRVACLILESIAGITLIVVAARSNLT